VIAMLQDLADKGVLTAAAGARGFSQRSRQQSSWHTECPVCVERGREGAQA
jgi:hypothetical protein